MTNVDNRTLRIPCPDGRLDELLPPDVVSLWRELVALKDREHQSHTALARAKAALDEAEKADAGELATAIRAGGNDPGPTNVNAARAALDEAQRHASAFEVAVDRAAGDLTKALSAIDKGPLVRDFETRAAAARTECEDHVARARAARNEMLAMRDLSLFVAAFPDSPIRRFGERFHDAQAWDQFGRKITEDLNMIEKPRPPIADKPAAKTDDELEPVA